MKGKLRKVIAVFLSAILVFNSGINVGIANDGRGDYYYGAIAFVSPENDNISNDSRNEKGRDTEQTALKDIDTKSEDTAEGDIKSADASKTDTKSEDTAEGDEKPADTSKADTKSEDTSKVDANTVESSSENGSLSLLLQDEIIVASLSRDGNFSSRSFRNTGSRGITSRAGDREDFETSELEVEEINVSSGITLTEESDIPEDIAEKIDGIILKYIILTGNITDLSEATGTFTLNDDTDNDIKAFYITPSGDIEELTVTEDGSDEYSFSISELEIESRNAVLPATAEISDEIDMPIVLYSAEPIVSSEENDFTASDAISPSNLVYFNANFFNYDARKFNFATRALQLKNSGVASTVDEAASLLKNASTAADAGNYAVNSTKNTLLFNFSATDYHYNTNYNTWLSSIINSTTRTWLNFNKPYLAQNNWTNQLITPGIVGNIGSPLVNDLPDFKFAQAGLFIPMADKANRTLVEFNDGVEEEWIIAERLNLKFPFKNDGNGYYVFDSESMYIDNVLSKNGTNNKIQLFENSNAPQVGSKVRGFWPFATGHTFQKYLDGGQSSSTTVSENELSDQYHFGMNLEAKFVVPKDFKVNNNPMVFEFTGDDDLWIYIDGKLVMDVGGCHKALGGKIDFMNGTVTYFDPYDDPKSDAYNLAVLTLPEGENNWNTAEGNDLFNENSNTSTNKSRPAVAKSVTTSLYNIPGLEQSKFYEGSVHDIEIFYLERGTGESNCKMKFNIATISDIETEKTAYVYDSETDIREINSADSFAYTGQDVRFDLEVKNNSGQILNNVIVYDKELDLLFDKNGIITDVNLIATTDDAIYAELNSTTFSSSDYFYIWEDDDIVSNFTKLAINGVVNISEHGVKVSSIVPGNEVNNYGTDSDRDAIEDVLKKRTKKDIRLDNEDINTMYAIGRCDSVVFGKPYVEDCDDIQYEIRDTELYVRQIVVDEDDNLVDNPKDAILDTSSSRDNRSLYFPSNRDYKKYTSYYNNVDYTAVPTIPSDYKLIKIDVRDDITDFEPMDLDEYNNETEFSYKGEEYRKYVTVYLRRKENDDWHNNMAIVNKFNKITVR